MRRGEIRTVAGPLVSGQCTSSENQASIITLSEALSRPTGLEAEAAKRFDAARMSALGIYPGRQSSVGHGRVPRP
jgi:hypothetical protein